MKKFSLLIIFILSISLVSAGSASFVHRSIAPDFNNYYRGSLDTYYPSLGDPSSCEARQDIILQISPGGCQPSVVRSDLLAEQNVPVFCQIDAIKINPLIDISQIRNIRFTGSKANGILDVGFHPARAALRTTNMLLGSPIQQNIGYAVVILKQNAVEKDLPDFVNVTLNARLDYYANNALGLGRSDFLLKEVSENDWKSEKRKQTFFRGKYSIRLDSAEPNRVAVSIYDGDRKIKSEVLEKEKRAKKLYLPGSYCQIALDLSFGGFVSADETAKLNVDGDILDVYKGSTFLNGKCRVTDLDVKGKSSGTIGLICGSERFDLSLNPINFDIGDNVKFVDNVKDKDGNFIVTKIDNKNKVVTLSDSSVVSIGSIMMADGSKLTEAKYESDLEGNYGKMDESYGEIVSDFHDEKEDRGDYYGVLGLKKEINLAKTLKKQVSEMDLINKLRESYPDEYTQEFSSKLNNLYQSDSSEAVAVIDIDNGLKTISVLGFDEPKDKSKVDFVFGSNNRFTGKLNEEVDFSGNKLIVKDVNSNNVKVDITCSDNNNEISKTLVVDTPVSDICGDVLKVTNVDIKSFARVNINPVANTATETNLSVNIGIEKRALKLSPDKIKKKIENLNKTIKKWEGISDNLGTAVTGLKAACFATSGLLTIKNFFTGLSGEALARKEVMQGENGWTKWCTDKYQEQGYSSVDDCLRKKSPDIDKDVKKMTEALKNYNEKLKGWTDDASNNGEVGIFQTPQVDSEKVLESVGADLLSNYGNKKIDDKQVSDIVGSSKSWNLDINQIRDLRSNLDVINTNGYSEVMKSNANARIKELKRIAEANGKVAESENALANILGPGHIILNNGFSSVWDGGYTNNKVDGLGNVSAQAVTYQGKNYMVILEKGGDDKSYVANKVYSFEGGNLGPEVSSDDGILSGIQSKYGIFTKLDGSYHTPISNFKVRYFESEPFKGMSAIVPVDTNNGWYAGAKQTLPGLGGIKAFEKNGQAVSFWLCNAIDGKVEFDSSNFGNDQCRRFDINTGSTSSPFQGISQTETDKLIREATQAFNDAARQDRTRGTVRILGNDYSVGNPMAAVSEAQCQNFMSPKDCQLLFNVCDPVICPSSRCDFGGKFRVDNVIQSGIVGSALLCLPNFNEGIYVPVCLSGLKAGADNYLSILQAHQACLQENLDTGKTVGICDEITSVYTCEFFWRQAAPLANILLPKATEFLYTGGRGEIRGGGEYLNVQGAWQNTKDSINFFKDHYAVDSLNAFRARSVEEAGGQFCKSFISMTSPTSFKTLIEPDSPTQFTAWFNAIPFSDATVPASSQYKVFYHIFAGKDAGVHFSVYLKDPPESSYYRSTPTIQVDSGFLGRGQTRSETRDFTAPEGYKQLCVSIDGKEECGFKQVSTSFALNYLKDKFVSDELKKTDIKTENECISGRANAAALLNPNIQEAGQEALSPEIYNRGIVRICSTDNPGLSTDPSRFTNVGYCGNERVRCWLDSKSVENSLNFESVKNSTLSVLEKNQGDNIYTKGDSYILGASNEIDAAEDNINGLNDLLGKVVMNKDKARILYLLGNAYGNKVNEIYGNLNSGNANVALQNSGAGVGGNMGAIIDPIGATLEGDTEGVNRDNGGRSIDSNNIAGNTEGFTLEKNTSIYYNGEYAGMYLKEVGGKSLIYLEKSLFGIDFLFQDLPIGDITNKGNIIISIAEDKQSDLIKLLKEYNFDSRDKRFIKIGNNLNKKIYDSKKCINGFSKSKGGNFKEDKSREDIKTEFGLLLNCEPTDISFLGNYIYWMIGGKKEKIGSIDEKGVVIINETRIGAILSKNSSLTESMAIEKLDGQNVNEIPESTQTTAYVGKYFIKYEGNRERIYFYDDSNREVKLPLTIFSGFGETYISPIFSDDYNNGGQVGRILNSNGGTFDFYNFYNNDLSTEMTSYINNLKKLNYVNLLIDGNYDFSKYKIKTKGFFTYYDWIYYSNGDSTGIYVNNKYKIFSSFGWDSEIGSVSKNGVVSITYQDCVDREVKKEDCRSLNGAKLLGNMVFVKKNPFENVRLPAGT